MCYFVSSGLLLAAVGAGIAAGQHEPGGGGGGAPLL